MQKSVLAFIYLRPQRIGYVTVKVLLLLIASHFEYTQDRTDRQTDRQTELMETGPMLHRFLLDAATDNDRFMGRYALKECIIRD